MKKQNDPKKTKHYTAYNDRKRTHIRMQETVESIPEECWWVRQFLRGVYYTRDKK